MRAIRSYHSSVLGSLLVICCLSLFLVLFSACRKHAPPPPPPAVDVRPEPQLFEHTVRYSGETLGLISSWYTGRSSNWQIILESNPGMRPERINIGNVILIPEGMLIRREPLPQTIIGSSMRSAPTKVESLGTQSSEGQGAATSTEAAGKAEAASVEEISPLSEADLGLLDQATRKIEASEEEVSSGAEEVSSEVNKKDTPPKDASSTTREDLERERLLDELLQE